MATLTESEVLALVERFVADLRRSPLNKSDDAQHALAAVEAFTKGVRLSIASEQSARKAVRS